VISITETIIVHDQGRLRRSGAWWYLSDRLRAQAVQTGMVRIV